MSWWLLLCASVAFALPYGCDVVTALAWGRLGVLNFGSESMAPIDVRFEPERFGRRLTISLVIFLFSTLFFFVALFAILKSPQS
jgi:hypothetical protein